MARSTRSRGKRHRRDIMWQTPIYHSLNAARKELRILNISPRLSKGRLDCWFSTSSLLDSSIPAYGAVSWSWGVPERKKDILVENKVVSIPENAVEALKRMCFDQTHLRVWIDVVCINQNDLKERASQVGMMKDVYEKADCVLVWLGEGDETNRRALNSIDLLIEQCTGTIPEGVESNEFFRDADDIVVHSNQDLPEGCDWRAIMRMYSARWFSRLWVAQEVMLSRKAICYLGDLSRSWPDITLAAQWLVYANYQRPQYCNQMVAGIEHASQLWRCLNRDFDLTRLLYLSTGLQTTLPLDKIYGILGLLSDEAFWIAAHEGLLLDYEQDLHIAYSAATRAAIKIRSGRVDQLDVLEYAQSRVPVPSQSYTDHAWPSWVPRLDWVFDPDLGSPQYIRTFGVGASNGMIGPTAQSSEWERKNTLLRISGFLVDKVAACGHALDAALLNDMQALAAEFCHCRTMLRSPTIGESGFGLTFTCRRNEMAKDASNDPVFTSAYEAFSECCDDLCASMQVDDIRPYLNAIRKGSLNRVYFTTAGGLIGMGPRGMRIEDQICILPGGDVPFIVRQDDEYFRLIGSAYVHDIMEGQYIQLMETENRLHDEMKEMILR